MSFEVSRADLGRAVSRRGIPASTAWPWLCPRTGGTACEILAEGEQGDRRVEAWYDEVHRYLTIAACGEDAPAGTVGLMLLNRPDWDADRGPEPALRECVNLLRPGGCAVFTLSNRWFGTFIPKARSAGARSRDPGGARGPYLPLPGLEERCRALGFSRLQIYLFGEEPGYVRSLVPYDRTALMASEGLRMPKGVMGHFRLGAAAVGLGGRLYPRTLVIAER